jgi:Spy/CpxP family protein refolding chaperone
VNTWKVILATIVIFGAGVVTGGLLVHHEVMRLPPPRNPHPQPRPVGQAPLGAMRLEFLRRAQRELDLTPEQRERVDKIIKDSQERTHKLVEPIMRDQIQRARQEFLDVLTPEQRGRFDEFIKEQQRQREQHRQPPAHTERKPEAVVGAVTNSP